jgi:4-diphosphocytidyl-2-C-methyl-D-erythritol kinase
MGVDHPRLDREARHVTALRMIAPAKINWTLEVLRRRPDGYHEVRSVLQTIDLLDVVSLRDADRIEIELSGDAGALAGEDPQGNLAYRAAQVFAARTGIKRGVRIGIDKRIPVATGLGGGSSDAAAVLRGLNTLWKARQSESNLVEIAAEVGSDPPFFVVGGTAVVSGRGEQVAPLDDAIAPPMLLAIPPAGERGEKTASMYAALTPDDYSEGDASTGGREAIDAGRALVDAQLANVFERVIAGMQPDTANAMNALRAQGYAPHLCGSGPSFFLLVADDSTIGAVSERITRLGFGPHRVQALPRRDATRIERI